MDHSADLNPEQPPRQSSALRRRNSIATPVEVRAKLSLPNITTTKPLHGSHSFPYQNGTAPSLDMELISSLKSSLAYTSLKDLLPSSSSDAAVASPTAANSGYQISIRNRLVKQAAWAYLQPMSSSPSSSGPHFLRRLCLRLSTSLTACLAFIQSHLVPALAELLDRILHAFRIRTSS